VCVCARANASFRKREREYVRGSYDTTRASTSDRVTAGGRTGGWVRVEEVAAVAAAVGPEGG
jgi:hypothetical protein